jgi:hypothetical protein
MFFESEIEPKLAAGEHLPVDEQLFQCWDLADRAFFEAAIRALRNRKG